ncbi:MAG: YdeI/OmpD-associated family protein [Verrucomicrobiota bacterium]|jgi:uncharacterized protein YdeI (YjbR/CyaY-like superfamily)
MPKKDPCVDTYIAKSADFARPILNRIRQLVHAACPDVEETIKWHAPFFVHKGNLITMPAFKRHCALIFWKGRLFLNKDQKTKLRRLTSLSELPDDKILTGYIRKAVELNEAGIKTPRPKPKPKKAVVVPDYFLAALKKNKKALAAFEDFSPSHKREYVEWITEAKREKTRAKRIKAAIKQMTQGKSLNWKYQ